MTSHIQFQSSEAVLQRLLTNQMRGAQALLRQQDIQIKFLRSSQPLWKFLRVQLSYQPQSIVFTKIEGSKNLQNPPKSIGIQSLSLMSSDGASKQVGFILSSSTSICLLTSLPQILKVSQLNPQLKQSVRSSFWAYRLSDFSRSSLLNGCLNMLAGFTTYIGGAIAFELLYIIKQLIQYLVQLCYCFNQSSGWPRHPHWRQRRLAGAGLFCDYKPGLYLYLKQRVMLTIKELQALIEVLNRREETLQRIEELFLSKFKDSQGVFRATYAMANLINLNLLTSLQRIPAIFLLIQNYKNEGISRHPFGATILELVQNTPEPFEKRMITDIIIDMHREQYAKTTVDYLYEQEQSMITPLEDRPEIKQIKDQFILNLPQISQKSQSEVKNVVRDFIEKERQNEIPEHHVNLGTIKQAQINEQSYNIGFMRPIPKFIDVDPSEFHWLSPSICPEVMWDSTAETSRKLARAKTLLRKACDQHLTKDECTQIEKALDCQPNAALHMEVGSQMLSPLIKQNAFMAVAYLIKVSNYPIIETYLDALLHVEVSINSIEVANKFFRSAKVSSEFIVKYTLSLLGRMLEMDESNKDKSKLAKSVISFVKHFKKSKLGNSEELNDRLEKFLDEFIAVDEVQQFRKLMAKQ